MSCFLGSSHPHKETHEGLFPAPKPHAYSVRSSLGFLIFIIPSRPQRNKMAAPRGPLTPLFWPCAPAARLARCPAAGTRLLAPLGAGTVQTGTGSDAPGLQKRGPAGAAQPGGPPGAALTTRRAPAPPPQRGWPAPGRALRAPRPLRGSGLCGERCVVPPLLQSLLQVYRSRKKQKEGKRLCLERCSWREISVVRALNAARESGGVLLNLFA